MQEVTWSNTHAQAGSSTASCSGVFWDNLSLSLRMETPSSPWAICISAHLGKVFLDFHVEPTVLYLMTLMNNFLSTMYGVQIFCYITCLPSNPNHSVSLCSSAIEIGHGIRSRLKPYYSTLPKGSCSQATWAASLGQPKCLSVQHSATNGDCLQLTSKCRSLNKHIDCSTNTLFQHLGF